MNLPTNVSFLIDIIENNGFEAYAVGGFVRDSLMNRSCDDVDIASSATPLELEEILKKHNIKFIETGLQHGTITVLYSNQSYEITTFRTDGEYFDNRHPDNISFVRSLKDDLSRRDFTINAMAYNASSGVIDVFGGLKDIDNKLIRAVGDADKRFKEDALRIMRAIRFSSALGFDIEPLTKKALFDNKHLLKNISPQRIFNELKKLLNGDNVYEVLMEYKEILAVIIPELIPTFNCSQNTPWHIYDVFEHIAKAVEFAPKEKNYRLALFFHDIGKPVVKITLPNGRDSFKKHALVGAEITKDILKRFKCSNALIDNVYNLVKYHQHISNLDSFNVKEYLSKLDKELLYQLFIVRIADLKAHVNNDSIKYEIDYIEGNLINEYNRILSSGEAYKISHLMISGNDLMVYGYHGEDIGKKLNDILKLVINDKLKNNKEDILQYIKNGLKE